MGDGDSQATAFWVSTLPSYEMRGLPVPADTYEPPNRLRAPNPSALVQCGSGRQEISKTSRHPDSMRAHHCERKAHVHRRIRLPPPPRRAAQHSTTWPDACHSALAIPYGHNIAVIPEPRRWLRRWICTENSPRTVDTCHIRPPVNIAQTTRRPREDDGQVGFRRGRPDYMGRDDD
ncbi:hypothetical protein D9611_014229 [Ephemerocybe angulata]|uniref:Uncharacterized protein n=1 Tax=Ephemerocybe angulata TaxID=980116 RepID=A0A8H5EZI5_9AGAR|nr:hypothetical protein D9611_014229 [Tulosesus angulatus]